MLFTYIKRYICKHDPESQKKKEDVIREFKLSSVVIFKLFRLLLIVVWFNFIISASLVNVLQLTSASLFLRSVLCPFWSHLFNISNSLSKAFRLNIHLSSFQLPRAQSEPELPTMESRSSPSKSQRYSPFLQSPSSTNI